MKDTAQSHNGGVPVEPTDVVPEFTVLVIPFGLCIAKPYRVVDASKTGGQEFASGGWEELRPQGKAGGAAGAEQPSEEGVPPTGKKGAPSADFV